MIRRTESSGNGQQLAWRFKDLLYFRNILRDYDISLMRDYLQTHIEAVHIQKDQPYELLPGYRYIASENTSVHLEDSGEHFQLKEGYPLQDVDETLIAQEETIFYRISLKTEIILEKLYRLNLPIFAEFKSHERLRVLEKCEVVDVSFGGYVFREGEAADAIYWLLEGQVKILKRKQYKVIEIRTLEKDRMFGLYCLKHGKTVRELSTKVSQNGTQVLIIYREQLEQMCLEKGITMDKLLENIKSELHYPVKAKSVPRKIELNREELRKREQTLCKRIKGFETERNLKNSYINDLLQTKTLLFKVRDLNETSKRESRAGGVKKYVFDLSSEKKSRRFQDRGRYTQAQTPRTSTPSGSMVRSFLGLTQYSSVRRFMSGMMSKQ